MSLLDDLIENIRKANGNTNAEIELQINSLSGIDADDKAAKIESTKSAALDNATKMASAIETFVEDYLKSLENQQNKKNFNFFT